MDTINPSSKYYQTVPTSVEETNAYYYSTKAPSHDVLTVMYDKWASTYDKDYRTFGYEGPRETAEALARVVKDKNAKILDVCSGTGMTGKQLQKQGYGNIDGVDMSSESIKICEQKQLYKSLICSKVTADPLDIKADIYDAVVTCGSFIPGHLHQSCFPELTRIVKSGGFVIIAMREEYTWIAEEYRDNQLENAMKKMADDGKWKVTSRTRVPYFFNDKHGLVFVFEVL